MDRLRTRRFGEPGVRLDQSGEAGLLDRLSAMAAAVGRPGFCVTGDDGAVWQVPDGRDLVVSQDCQVEDVDFRREWIRPHQLGRRALAVALSDLAAMGAHPSYALVTLCAPGSTVTDDVIAIQAGLCEAAAESACALIGGDVSSTAGPLVIDVSVAGTVARGELLRRDGGRPGDLLVVTGVLGRAAAGLTLLREPRRVADVGADAEVWLGAQLEPDARVEEGQALVRAGVSCAGDLSDGLWVDAGRTARASDCEAELWADVLPVDPGLRVGFSDSWFDLSVGGGEDFELLAAVAPAILGPLRTAWRPHLAPLTVVGRLVGGEGVRCLDREGGSPHRAPVVSSRHYR